MPRQADAGALEQFEADPTKEPRYIGPRYAEYVLSAHAWRKAAPAVFAA